jgi:hypothetical protein
VSVKAGRWIPELRHELFPARSESFSLTEMFEEKTPLPKQETVGVSTNYCIVFFSPGSCHDVEPCIMRSARAAFFLAPFLCATLRRDHAKRYRKGRQP